ncbi:MAG: hypothetical protein ACJ8DI_05855 [Ktedonobacteraceae bacterium]
MNLPSAPGEARVSADQQSQGGTGLHGHWFVLARMLWIAIFLLTLVVFCANLKVGSYGPVTTILLVANTSVWFAVGLVLFWRKSTDRAILLISLQLVLTTGFFIPHYPGALVNDGVWWVPIDLLGLLAGTTLIFVYTFPDGRFVPGFTRWLALGWVAVSLLPVPILGNFSPWNWWLSPLYALVRIAFYGSLALALLYRYRWMSTPVQRQQIKWVVFAATIVTGEVSLGSLLAFVLPLLLPSAWPLNPVPSTRRIDDIYLACPFPPLHRDRPVALPALGYRHHHQSHAGLWDPDGDAGAGVLRPDHRPPVARASNNRNHL